MANVIFKRGLQKNLPAQAEDGVFYLTTDTNRLYVGDGTNKKLLNQTVQIVPSISDLTSLTTTWGADASQHINDFYYVSGLNILAVYTGSGEDGGWKQINPDHNTTIDSVDVSASVANETATVEVELTDSNEQPITGTIDISASGSAHITSTANGFEISGDKYTLQKEVSVDQSTATIKLVDSNGVAADTTKIDLISSQTANLKFENTAAGINIITNDSSLSGGSVAITANNGTLGVTVEDSNNNQATGSLENVGVVLNDGTYAPLVSSATGTSTGAIYSKAEIDSKLNGIDGMTYKGTIGASGATVATLPSTGVKNGDTYVIVSKGWTAANFTGATFETETAREMSGGTRVGDMLIAKGTETNDVITSDLTWTYIPAGNDSLDAVTYSAIVDTNTNSIRLDNANDTTIAKIGFVAGTDITLSSAVATNGNTDDTLTTTINHATYNAVTPVAASTLSNGSASFTAIKGLTLSNGHVTGIETDTYTPVTYDLEGAAASNNSYFNSTSNSGTNEANVKIRLINSNDSYSTNDADFQIESSSIKISTSNSKVTMNFEWGSF